MLFRAVAGVDEVIVMADKASQGDRAAWQPSAGSAEDPIRPDIVSVCLDFARHAPKEAGILRLGPLGIRIPLLSVWVGRGVFSDRSRSSSCSLPYGSFV